MTRRVAIQMDPIEHVNINADSTFVLALEAQKRGFEVWVHSPDDLIFDDGTVMIRTRRVTLRREDGNHVNFGPWERLAAQNFNILLLRQDPPYDMHYLTTTYLLEMVHPDVLVVNDPRAVRDFPEKLFAVHFPSLTPPTMFTRNMSEIKSFRAKHEDIIVKPLYGNGGAGVFHIMPDDENLGTIIEMLLSSNRDPIVCQKYLADVRGGDKRIILVDGEAIGVVNRIPAAGDARANMHAGGQAVKCKLSDRDKEICDTIGPVLRNNGLIFVGIDVIGQYLTEINITSPTGIQEINRFDGANVEATIWDAIERRL